MRFIYQQHSKKIFRLTLLCSGTVACTGNGSIVSKSSRLGISSEVDTV